MIGCRATRAACVAACLLAAQGAARADLGLSFSLGAGFTFGERAGPTSATAELTPFYDLGGFLLDLGLLYDFNTTRALTLRPGFRIEMDVLYFRAAMPLQVANGRDFGVYAALGKTFQFDTLGAFLEVGKAFLHERGVASSPLEVRLGLNFHF
jgi:hypothetical protein